MILRRFSLIDNTIQIIITTMAIIAIKTRITNIGLVIATITILVVIAIIVI